MRQARNLVSRRTVAAGVAAGLAFAPRLARAAEFPNGPVRWVIPEPSGGSFDALSHGLAPFLGKQLGVPVVVQNVPGPEGVNQIYRAPPNGQTIGMGDALGEFAREIVVKPEYKIEEMTWIGRIDASINLVIASAKSPIKTFADLKGRKAPVRVSVFGVSAPFVQFVLLSAAANFPIAPINYRSISELIFGAVRGDTDLAILGVPAWLKQIQAGNVAPILAWTDERDPRIPTVPTLKELGYPSLIPFMNHRAIIAPPHLPAPIRARLIAAWQGTMADPGARAFLTKANFELNSLWGDDFEAVIQQMRAALPAYTETLRRLATQ